MQKPKQPGEYPDRDMDCQIAISDQIMALIQSARNAGWTETEASAAIMEVSAGLLRDFTGENPDE